MAGIGPVEADNIEIAVFDPDTSGKQPLRRFFAGLYVDHDATGFPKKLATHESEMVVSLLEVGIEQHHLREPLRQEPVRQGGGEGIQGVVQESFVALLEYGIAGTIIEV